MWISASIWVIVSCGSCLALFNRGLDAFQVNGSGSESEVVQTNICNNRTLCYCSWKQEFAVRYSKFRLTIGITSLFLVSFCIQVSRSKFFQIDLSDLRLDSMQGMFQTKRCVSRVCFFREFKMKLGQLKICSVSESQSLNSSGSQARNSSKMATKCRIENRITNISITI